MHLWPKKCLNMTQKDKKYDLIILHSTKLLLLGMVRSNWSWGLKRTTWTLRGKLEVGVEESVFSLFKRIANHWVVRGEVQTFKTVSYCLALNVELIKELDILLAPLSHYTVKGWVVRIRCFKEFPRIANKWPCNLRLMFTMLLISTLFDL